MKHINRNPQGFFKGKNWQIIRFGILFVVLTALIFRFFISEFSDEGRFSGYLNVGLAYGASLLLKLLGWDVKATGSAIMGDDLGIEIVGACNGMIVCIMYIAAVLAYPCKIKDKAIGIALGIFVIEVVNIIRIVCLIYVIRYFPASFETYHIYVAESVIIAIGVVLWLFWVEKFVKVSRQ